MDYVTDVAAASMSLSASKLMMNVGTSLTKKVMDTQEVQAQQLLEMLPSQPGLGEFVDVMA